PTLRSVAICQPATPRHRPSLQGANQTLSSVSLATIRRQENHPWRIVSPQCSLRHQPFVAPPLSSLLCARLILSISRYRCIPLLCSGMKTTSKRLLFWTPRVLCLLFAAFISLFALDVFGESRGFWQTALALAMHLIPTFILLAVLALSWRWEWIGGL